MNRQRPVLPRPSASPGSTDFVWATGIEDTFISQPNPRTGRIMDEYALTQHYDHWQEDLSLIAALGVPAARYGIPWYRVEPQPGTFDWSWTDQVLPALVNQYGVEPIVDLMHYGTPAWLEGSFLSSEYPDRVAEYARAFAAHFKGLCYWYTPLNEPRVNAWYAGRLGWWPPYARSWRGFVQIMMQLCRGICRTQQAVAAVEPEAVFVHVDATDLYRPADPLDSELAAHAQQRQELVFLALDLATGRFGEEHLLRDWLAHYDVNDADLAWFRDNAVRPHL